MSFCYSDIFSDTTKNVAVTRVIWFYRLISEFRFLTIFPLETILIKESLKQSGLIKGLLWQPELRCPFEIFSDRAPRPYHTCMHPCLNCLLHKVKRKFRIVSKSMSWFSVKITQYTFTQNTRVYLCVYDKWTICTIFVHLLMYFVCIVLLYKSLSL